MTYWHGFADGAAVVAFVDIIILIVGVAIAFQKIEALK